MIPQIKCYNPDHPLPDHCFFILNKGKNSGKPLDTPCPNCYIVVVNNSEMRDFYYHLVLGMFQARTFEPYLIGSVIEFIRIGEVKRLISSNENTVLGKLDTFRKLIAAIQRTKVQRETVYAALKHQEEAAKRGLASLLR